MTAQKIVVTDYEKINSQVHVLCENFEGEIVIEIEKSQFEDWLDYDDRLGFCMDWESGGNHQQLTGNIDLQEYWELDTMFIKKDLHDYLTSKII